MRTRPVQMNFTNGEIAPRLFGRSDLAKYWASLEELQNFVILPYGGVARRDGLHYVTAQSIETRKVRLIPFVFSTEQAYIIEAGHEYMRFFMNHGLILETADADAVLNLHMNGSPGSATFTDSGATVHTVSAFGTAQINDYAPLFGNGCGLFSAAGLAYLTVPDHADFDFSADDIFTFEVDLYQQTLVSGGVLMQKTDDDNYFQIFVWADGHVSFVVTHTGLSQIVDTATGALTINHHDRIRVVGDGVRYYVFVNGELLVDEAITKSMQDFTGDLYVGVNVDLDTFYNGRMDELLISNLALSIADYVPATHEYPLSTDPYEIVTPYLEGDLPLLKYFQSYDTMYIFHPDHAWRKLTRTAHATWSLDEIDFTNGPWLEEKTDVIFTPTATTGAIDITSNVDFFVEGHEGALLRMKNSDVWGYVKIDVYTDAQTVEATVVNELGSTADSTAYQEGAWSTYRGFPSAGLFNEESLVAAATDHQPQTEWTSKKGDFENFEAGSLDDDGFSYTIPASNRILWLGALRELVLGTGDGTYKMTGGMDDYISPTNVRVRPGMAIGAMNLGPIPVNNSLLYWQKGGRKLRELTYDPNSFDEGYVAPDLSLLADHMTLGGVRYSAWQQEPNSILWTVRADGVLLAMTYMRPEDIVGWGRHITDGEIESVAVIPDPTDTYNEVWVSVLRTIEGVDYRYIEYMDPDMMVDSGITYSGAAVESVSGLDHLEGETVDIVGDDVVYTQEVVAAGAVAIDPAASEIQIGLPYTSKLITMKPTIAAPNGTTAGLPKKWADLKVAVYETSGLTINDEVIDFRAFSDVGLGEAIPLYTGDVRVSQLGWGEGKITIEHSDPLPCTILGIYGNLESGSD